MPWIGAAIGVAGSLLSGSMSADAASSASQAQTQSSQAAIDEQRREYDQTRTDTAPYRATGVAANSRLAALLGIGPQGMAGGTTTSTPTFDQAGYDAAMQKWQQGGDSTDSYVPVSEGGGGYWERHSGASTAAAPTRDQFTQNVSTTTGGTPDSTYGSLTRGFTTADLNADPVYNSGLQFGLDQGTKAINARAIATGSYDSGATLKALTQYGNDYGSTKAGDAYNRFQTNQGNTYNRLAGISGTGQNAVNTVTSAGTNMANTVSNLQTGIGNANAAAIVGGSNSWGGALNNASTGYMNNQILQKLLGNSSSYNWSGSLGNDSGQLYGI